MINVIYFKLVHFYDSFDLNYANLICLVLEFSKLMNEVENEDYHHSSLCSVFWTIPHHIWSGGTYWCIMHLTLLKYIKSFDFRSLSWLL